MKKYFPYILFAFFNLPFFAVSQNKLSSVNSFSHLPDSTRLHTWWHWLEGGITKSGITKDLESMRSNGIVQATILNVSLFEDKDFSVKKIRFDSPEWYAMFEWALKEASRLDIKIGVHNCDGWNSSGGPWIQPEQSMKVITWSKTLAAGKRNIDTQLHKPFFRENYYEDVAVIAMPARTSLSSFQRANPVFILNDSVVLNGLGDGSATGGPVLKWGDKLTIQLNKPIAVSRIALQAHKSFTWQDVTLIKSSYHLYYSNDGIQYQLLDTIKLSGVNSLFEINVKPVTAQYFRLEFTEQPWTDPWLPLALAEVELLSGEERPLLQTDITGIAEKSVETRGSSASVYRSVAKNNERAIPQNQIIDITPYMNKNGVLSWNAPAGNWEIIRFGYTTTAYKNSPATKEGEGLECDKLDSNIVNFHFSKFPQKLINTAGGFTGNTFKFLLIDSWECAFQNWTKNLPAEFEKRRGYALMPFLPVLCGAIVTNAAVSESFLHDYRQTIAELIEENYYKQFAKLCHQNGLEMHAEVIYGNAGYPPLDVLKTNQYADVPMFEFWTGANPKTGLMEYNPQKTVNLDFPASAALFYNKKVFAAEAYTSMANYSESPRSLKPYGDRAYCTGINQLILHSYTHQPNERFPGMTLGPYGSHFNRHNPWFKYNYSWGDYHARIQQQLQKGQMQADVLHFAGDQLPQFVALAAGTNIPAGYQIHICNTDILENKLTVKAGKLIFGNVKFSILTLPENMGMELATLQRIAALVKEGVIVFGPRPNRPLSMAGLNQDTAACKKITDQLWGGIDGNSITENTYGKGKVFWGESLENVLLKTRIAPDFTTTQNDTLTFLFTHRVEADSDIYFVFNQTNQIVNRIVSFKTSRPNVTELNPVNGTTQIVYDKNTLNGHTVFNTVFAPGESKIFVFDNHKGQRVSKKTVSKVSNIPIHNLKATIDFDTKGYDSIARVTVDTLKSLTVFENTQIKYFSGFSNYSITFSINQSAIANAKKYFLDLGELGATAAVMLNGHNLGTVWSAGMKLDITGKLKAQNTLVVSVGNEYRNRIIGDLIEFGKLKNVWTSLDIKNALNADMPLKPAGLMGPLKITTE